MNIYSLVGLIAALAVGVSIVAAIIQRPKNWFAAYLRNFLGTFFIFSGVVKAIDPIGTQIKLEDYFNVFTEHFALLSPLWEFMHDYALIIGTGMIVLEIIIGITLILGVFRKPTLALYLGMILFFTLLTGFTFLTGYVPLDKTFFEFGSWTAFKDTQMRVTDCGCFGDFVKLKPYESFLKDVALTVLIFVMIGWQQFITPLFNKRLSNIAVTVLSIGVVAFALHNIYNLPVVDFRAYSVGTNIPEGMKDGVEPEVEMTYTLVNDSTKATKKVSSTDYIDKGIWKDKAWKIDKTKTEKTVISEGKLPTIKDFILFDKNSEDKADSLVQKTGYNFWVSAYGLKKASDEGFKRIEKVMRDAAKDGISAIGLTSDDIEKSEAKVGGAFEFYNLDATPIKTMMRSNPGVVLLKDGIIVAKYHHRTIPDWASIKADIGIK